MTLLAVAHRWGNETGLLSRAVDVAADVVELDVHLHKGRLEVRHTKTLGPLPWLWDRWYLVPASAPRLLLDEVLDAVAPGTVLMLDLKGPNRVGPAVARHLAARAYAGEVWVCARWWPSVFAFRAAPGVRMLLSARARWELAVLQRLLRRTSGVHGVSVHLPLLTPAVVDALHGHVERVLTWPVDDDAALARARAVGASGVISREASVLESVVRDRTTGVGA